jgi:hypothetical protein
MIEATVTTMATTTTTTTTTIVAAATTTAACSVTDGFRLRAKNGDYLVTKGDYVYASGLSDATKFKLVGDKVFDGDLSWKKHSNYAPIQYSSDINTQDLSCSLNQQNELSCSDTNPLVKDFQFCSSAESNLRMDYGKNYDDMCDITSFTAESTCEDPATTSTTTAPATTTTAAAMPTIVNGFTCSDGSFVLQAGTSDGSILPISAGGHYLASGPDNTIQSVESLDKATDYKLYAAYPDDPFDPTLRFYDGGNIRSKSFSDTTVLLTTVEDAEIKNLVSMDCVLDIGNHGEVSCGSPTIVSGGVAYYRETYFCAGNGNKLLSGPDIKQGTVGCTQYWYYPSCRQDLPTTTTTTAPATTT